LVMGGGAWGGRHDDDGPWRASPGRTEATNAERGKLRAEADAIRDELDGLDVDTRPSRALILNARLDELDDMDLAEVIPAGFTARLDPASAGGLHSTLADATAVATRAKLDGDAYYDEHGEMPADWDYRVFAEGSVPGEWADVAYRVYLDDPSVGVEVHLAAVPHGAGRDLDDLVGNDQGAVFSDTEIRPLLRLLGQVAPVGATEARHNLHGPDGRFIKAGSSSGRPSLADVVRGTAALGPKRQRRDGDTVADAVRAAARRSDTTGRPTQRTPSEHRAEGAREVADEVDKALAEAGVSDEVRQLVAARARAVADGHGKKQTSATPPKAKRVPARMDADRLVDVESRLASAGSTDDARQHLAGMTASQLRQIAEHTGVALGSGDTKARAIERIVNSVVGRRLDSDAITRMTNR
jgi:hypothetical protein